MKKSLYLLSALLISAAIHAFAQTAPVAAMPDGMTEAVAVDPVIE